MSAIPMKLVVLVGSVRQGSYNAAIARALHQLVPAGVTVEILPSVAGLPIYDADLQAAGFPEAVTRMADAIRAADGLVIVTPEYNYSVPGGLKNAIDWLSRLSPQPLAGKPILIQSASMGVFGGARAQYHLRQILVFLNGMVMNTPEAMVGAAHTKVDANGQLSDPLTRDFLAKQLQHFHTYVRRISAGARIDG
ncbi:chromate reductase [Oryzomicrobium terrae]|uniref:Chromate reductase n=1 Tax=Oryzomicrobium terrae TaxID=1735038 RepID=A0A5C1E8X9_9RHOO|nr:NADPH-dependent FMN reductase [Oryzomicrobium terrae]QEL65115.1 chromate reductase [Oryzomicrobium terrae]